MASDPLPEFHRPGSLDGYVLGFQTGLFQLASKNVTAGGWIHPIDVQVLNVKPKICDAPRNALVVADDHAWHTRQGYTGHIQVRCPQMYLIPGGGDCELKMRVVRQNRLAAGGVLPGDSPGVRSGLEFKTRAR